MKLRTSYVTNSSSYSTADIGVDNPVLKAIADKYKESINCNEVKDLFCGDEYDFTYIQDEMSAVRKAPKTLNELLDCILTIIEIEQSDDTDSNLIEEMINEIQDNRESVINSFGVVSWEVENQSIGSEAPFVGDEISWGYEYSPDTKKELYSVSYKTDDED